MIKVGEGWEGRIESEFWGEKNLIPKTFYNVIKKPTTIEAHIYRISINSFHKGVALPQQDAMHYQINQIPRLGCSLLIFWPLDTLYKS